MSSWEECHQLMQNFNDHYSLLEPHHKMIYDLASQIAPGGVAFEIGVCNGRTAALLGYCAREFGFEAHGVDPFILEGNPSEIQRKLNQLNLNYQIHVTRSNDLEWNKPLDLLLIDGDHSDPAVTHDCRKWLPFVKIGGFVILDDYNADYHTYECPHHAICRWVNKLLEHPSWQSLNRDRVMIFKKVQEYQPE